MRLPLLTEPNILLSQTAADVRSFDEDLKEIVHEMFETMYANGGIGLAAPQVGLMESIIVAHWSVEDGPVVMINPVITSRTGSARDTEGCLSLPGLNITVERSKKISITYLDVEGQQHSKDFVDLGARVIQHEIDHLSGKTLLDVCPRQLKRRYLRDERKRRRKTTV